MKTQIIQSYANEKVSRTSVKTAVRINLALLTLFFAGCKSESWTERGPFTEGDTYEVTCRCVSQSELMGQFVSDGYVPIDGTVKAARVNVCSDGAPPRDFLEFNVCRIQAESWAKRGESIHTNYECDLQSSRLIATDSCPVRTDESLVTGSVTSAVGNYPEEKPFPYHIDPSLRQTNFDSSADAVGELIADDLEVTAHLFKNRTAQSQGRGSIHIEGGLCDFGEQCPVLIKYLSVDIDDFTIVRPTIFAKDIRVENPRLTLSEPIEGIREEDGALTLPRAKLLLRAKIQGNQKTFLTENATLAGHSISWNNTNQYDYPIFDLTYEFFDSDISLRSQARVEVTGGAIKPRVSQTPSCNLLGCSHVILSAQNSRFFYGDSAKSYRWYAKNHSLLGTDSTLKVVASTEYPIRLEIESSSGRRSILKVEEPDVQWKSKIYDTIIEPPVELPPTTPIVDLDLLL